MRGLKSALVIFACLTLAWARQRHSKQGKEASDPGTDREGKSMVVFYLSFIVVYKIVNQDFTFTHFTDTSHQCSVLN